MDIRPLAVADLEQFLAVLGYLSVVNLTPANALAVFDQRARDRVQTFVCVLDGRVVGTASLIVEQKFIRGGGRVAHVEDVVVDPNYRRRGIGLALLAFLEGEARAAGCYKIILDSRADAVAFYQKAGYFEHEVEMRKNLPPAAPG